MAGLADRILGGEAEPYLSHNDLRRLLDMETNTYWPATVSSSTTVSNVIYSGSTTGSTYKAYYPAIYGDAVFPPEPAKPKTPRKPKPESDMAWLARRVAEVSWVPA